MLSDARVVYLHLLSFGQYFARLFNGFLIVWFTRFFSSSFRDDLSTYFACDSFSFVALLVCYAWDLGMRTRLLRKTSAVSIHIIIRSIFMFAQFISISNAMALLLSFFIGQTR